MALRPGNRMAHCRGTGASAPPSRKQESGGVFPPEPAGDTALWLSVPETAQLIAGVLWGYGRFRITSPGMESMP